MNVTLTFQILGAPFDTSKFKSQASNFSGCCALWENNSTFTARVVLKEIAVVRFAVYMDKGQGKL